MNRAAAVPAQVALALLALGGCRRHYPPVESFELSEGGGCATLEDTTPYCWGTDSVPPSDKPVVASGPSRAAPAPARFTLAGRELCDRNATPPACEQLPAEPVSFAESPHHACVVLPEGSVRCRGEQDHGRLGAGAGDAKVTRAVPGIEGAKTVAVGDDFSCALLRNLTVSCWGDNAKHALAQPDTSIHTEPVPVVGMFAVKKLGARGDQACASLTDGGLRCWGSVRGPVGASMGRPGTANNVPMPVQFP